MTSGSTLKFLSAPNRRCWRLYRAMKNQLPSCEVHMSATKKFSHEKFSITYEKNRIFIYGHWGSHPSFKTSAAGNALLQSIDLAVAAEEIGLDGVFPVHHFSARLASPLPLFSAISLELLSGRIRVNTISRSN